MKRTISNEEIHQLIGCHEFILFKLTVSTDSSEFQNNFKPIMAKLLGEGFKFFQMQVDNENKVEQIILIVDPQRRGTISDKLVEIESLFLENLVSLKPDTYELCLDRFKEITIPSSFMWLS